MTIPNALVRCEDGQIFTQCVNTASEPRLVTTPIIELEEFELISSTPPPPPQVKVFDMTAQNLTVSSKTAADRIQELNNTIPAEHLNKEEREHVADLINSNYDLFHLPGDALGKTIAVTHKIPDERAIRERHSSSLKVAVKLSPVDRPEDARRAGE